MNRTYNDVAQILSQYPSLSPRTDVHSTPCPACANEKPPLIHHRLTSSFRNSISQRQLGPAPSYRRHYTGDISWHHIPFPHINMDSSCLSMRASSHLCYTDRDYGGSARTACRSAGSSLSPIPRWLGRLLGCMLPPLMDSQVRDYEEHGLLTMVFNRNPTYSTSWP